MISRISIKNSDSGLSNYLNTRKNCIGKCHLSDITILTRVSYNDSWHVESGLFMKLSEKLKRAFVSYIGTRWIVIHSTMTRSNKNDWTQHWSLQNGHTFLQPNHKTLFNMLFTNCTKFPCFSIEKVQSRRGRFIFSPWKIMLSAIFIVTNRTEHSTFFSQISRWQQRFQRFTFKLLTQCKIQLFLFYDTGQCIKNFSVVILEVTLLILWTLSVYWKSILYCIKEFHEILWIFWNL